MKPKSKNQARSNNGKNTKTSRPSQARPGKIQEGKSRTPNTRNSASVSKRIMGSAKAGVFSLARTSYLTSNASIGNNISHASSSWNTISQTRIYGNAALQEGVVPVRNEIQLIEEDRVTVNPSPQFYKQAQGHDLFSKDTNIAAPPSNIKVDTFSQRETTAPKKKQLPTEPLWEKIAPSEEISSIERAGLMEEKIKIPPHLLSQKYFGSYPR